MSTKKALVKSTGVISFATTMSRALGFIRDILFAKYFGTGIAAQAFVVAFKLPNLLRDLIGEGATNAAFVPVLAEYKATRSDAEFWKLARVILKILLLVLIGLVGLGLFLAPLIVRAIAPGFMLEEPEKLALTIRLTRIMFPYIFLVGLAAYAMGVLHTLRHFGSPAFGPAIFNLVLIVFLLGVCRRFGIVGQAIAVLVGGVLQLLVQVPFLYKRGWRPDFKVEMRHPAAKKIGQLLIPRAVGSAVYQLNVLVDNVLASFSLVVGAGGVAALYYANRLFQFPLAIFGIAMSEAALPTMAHHASKNDIGKLKETLTFSLRSIFIIMVPASLALILIGRPITEILFQRGEFGSSSTDLTYLALAFYAIGLVGCSGIKIMVAAFYALQDTKTPVKTASLALLSNVVLNLILMWPLKLGGLALATSISATGNFLLLFWILRKKIGNLGGRKILAGFLKSFVAACVMGLFLQLFSAKMIGPIAEQAAFVNMRNLAGLIFLGIAIYLGVAFLIGLEEIRKIARWILKKR